MVPNFVGREIECDKIITSLTSESTRHVNIHGSPGFGKTSTAISIGHNQKHLSRCLSLAVLISILMPLFLLLVEIDFKQSKH